MTNLTNKNLENRFRTSQKRWQHIEQTGWSVLIQDDGSWNAVITFNHIEPFEFEWKVEGLYCRTGNFFSETGLQVLVGTNYSENESVYVDLILDLINKNIENFDQLIDELEFRRFWWRKEVGILAPKLALGLCGELIFINQLLDESKSKLITAWTGPEKSRHDFTFGNDLDSKINFEIKVSGSSEKPRKHVISSLSQLDTQDSNKLVLVSMEMNIDTSGSVSLRGLINLIEEKIELRSIRVLFLEKLSEYGWDPRHPDYVFNVNFEEIQMYDVHSNFPRLTGNIISLIGLDERIGIKEYTISMLDLEGFVIKDCINRNVQWFRMLK